MSSAVLSVTFSDDTPLSSSIALCASSSSPSGPSRSANSGQAREALVPLAPAKTVAALNRRGVYFSPQTDTKYFHSEDSIVLSLKDVPPPSIRSYLNNHLSSPPRSSSPALPSSRGRSDTPTSHRGILKQRLHEIRLAASVEEGTLNNKEAARLLVTGKRPKLMARDSFQLAMLQKAASDGLEEQVGNGKGKERMVEELLGSDDSVLSEESIEQDGEDRDGSSEMEEEVEEDGPLTTASLVTIILDGAEDLLTLEEAYNTLALRLRHRIPRVASGDNLITEDDIRLAISPIRDEAPAMVRAMQRDLQRLMGRVPNSEVPSSEADSSPFRGLMPLRDGTPVNRSRLTPSPTPLPPPNKRFSPDGKMLRQGYTESEVRYRREASGVGAAALRFLAFTFHTHQLYSCFSDADIISLLDQIMLIPRTPRLPTPNPKRSYYLSILVLAQMKVPTNCVTPIRDKLSRALESALSDNLGSSSPTPIIVKENPNQVRKEAFLAVVNLITTYPSIMFQSFSEFLPHCLRGLVSPSSLMRNKASAAVAAIASTKLNLLSDYSSREMWQRNKIIIQRLEFFVVSHFKSPLRTSGKSVYGTNGEKKSEWTELERVFKETVGSASDVQWACATWAVVVTLMGAAYASSGLAPGQGFDHILDRSLQPSTNAVRPLLASVAWYHAIHAYFSSGMAISLSDENAPVISYKPFATSASGDYVDQLATLQLPYNHAIALAHDAKSVSKLAVEGRWTWYRTEKTKKFQWMITCGLSAATIVYAFTGMALDHQEQPAKEMSAITGLLSSDGAPLPESVAEDSKIDRLDKTWSRVVRPMIKSLGTVCGVDRLKIHGWAILEFITAVPPANPPSWTIDRLLSIRYLAGDAFALEKDNSLHDLMDGLEAETIRANEIPPWGINWTARNVDKLLDLFQEMLTGIGGLTESNQLKWVKSEHGFPILPVILSRIWSNILHAIAVTREEDNNKPQSDTYLLALSLINRHLLHIFNRDPTSYIPISQLTLDGSCSTDADTLRLSLFAHLTGSALVILGPEAFGTTRIPVSPDADTIENIIKNTAFGANPSGQATLAGRLLGQLLRAQVLKFPLRPAAASMFKVTLSKLINAGSVAGFSGKLLGDMTNHMPWIFQDQEEVQLDLWRLLGRKWVEVIDLQPSAATTGTNHTGALLVSLLSCPFRGRQVTSVWHQDAKAADLALWQDLLKVTVLRFRAKGVGSNLGVLESLAGHLSDFLDQSEDTSFTTITLSCLASALSWMSFVQSEAHHASHFAINENFVPAEFLILVSTAMHKSYPFSEIESSSSAPQDFVLSPGLGQLLNALKDTIAKLPAEFVGDVIEHCKGGVALWMQDEAKIADDELARTLDDLYIATLGALAGAIEAGHLPSTVGTMDDMIHLFAPRLSRAKTAAVPRAFQDFYNSSFPNIRLEDMSDEVCSFVGEVLSAVPGLITVPGLVAATGTMSEEESQKRFPNARQIPVMSTPSLPTLVHEETFVHPTGLDATADPSPVVNLDPTGEYDADVSQPQSTQPPRRSSTSHLMLKQDAPSSPPPPSKQPSSSAPSSPAPTAATDGDVFGPNAPPKTRKGRSRKRGNKSRPSEDSNSKRPKTRSKDTRALTTLSLPETLAPQASSDAASEAAAEEDEEDCIFLYEAHAAPTSARNRQSRFQVPKEEEVELISTRYSTSHITPVATKSNHSSRRRPSILSSAKGWLSRVPSFGLFSPNNATLPPDQLHSTPIVECIEEEREVVEKVILGEEPEVVEEREPWGKEPKVVEAQVEDLPHRQASIVTEQSARRTRRGKHRETPPKTASKSTEKDTSIASTVSKRRGGKSPRGSLKPGSSPSDLETTRRAEPVELEEDEEEDELLLSPESARKRRREEEGAIAKIALSKTDSPRLPRTRSRRLESANTQQENQDETQQSSGRFDDAPDSQVPTVPDPSFPTPIRRSAQQTRVLSMLDEAARSRSAIEGLDFEGVLTLMRNVDTLRAAAQKTLGKRAGERRIAKRSKRSS